MPDVFAPVALGPATLRNRIVKAATFEGRTPNGTLTNDLIAFHRGFARGGVGLTTVAYLAVSPDGRTDRNALHAHDFLGPRLADLADAVHAEGGAVSGQIGHAGPVANGRSNGVPAIAPTPMPSPLSMQWVRRASERDLTRVTRDHARVARLLVRAGFDAVEMHLGHNYLASAFLSPLLNRRRDRWGGSLTNRARLARQLVRAVRDEVGDEIAVLAKLNISDGAPGGFAMPESLDVASMLEADGGLDALELSAGSSLLNPMYLFRGDAPRAEFAAAMPGPVRLGMKVAGGRLLKSYPFREAYLRDKALEFRRRLDLPLMLLGGVTGLETMRQAMADGFDFVVMGRALLRDPDLPRRLQAGQATESACIHCNRCMPTIYTRTRCTETDREPADLLASAPTPSPSHGGPA